MWSRHNKYNNHKTELDGKKFDSIKEASRYAELKLMEKAGEIKDLELQKRFLLLPAFTDKTGTKHRAVTYVADFVYKDKTGEEVIEDVKSPATRSNPVYKIKKKLMAYKGNPIREV